MTFNSKFRTLAFAGTLALSGCAARQAVPNASTASPQPHATTSETPSDRCQSQNRTRIQNCIIETIVSNCRTASSGNEDNFYSCVSDGLRLPETSDNRQYRLSLGQGDEVFSLRNATGTVTDVARLEINAIDTSGVVFNFDIERIATSQPEIRMSVQHATARLNFDGSRSGQWDFVSITEIWNLAVENGQDGHVSVSFDTANPKILARTQ